MATITLYANQVNQMSSVLQKVSKSVQDLKDDILDLRSKALQIDNNICNIDDVIASLRNATSIDEGVVEKVDDTTDLMDEFIDTVVDTDEEVAEMILQSTDDFYDAYPYLAPQTTTLLDSLVNALTGFAEWAADAFAAVLEFIGTLILAVLAIVVIAIVAAIVVILITAIAVTVAAALVSLFSLLATLISAYVLPVLAVIGLFIITHPIISIIIAVTAYFAISALLNFIGKKTGNTDLKEIAFAMRHPIIALQVGKVIPNKGKTNISTNAARFATDFDFEEYDNNEGSEVNAFRHSFWVSIITNKWGEDIARQLSNTHEANSNALDNITDPYSYQFSSMTAADEAVDLLNNRIGVQVGQSLPEGASQKDIARAILDYYHDYGLNVVVPDGNGNYIIEQQRLSDERYQANLATLDQLDENGFPPDSEYYNGDN